MYIMYCLIWYVDAYKMAVEFLKHVLIFDYRVHKDGKMGKKDASKIPVDQYRKQIGKSFLGFCIYPISSYAKFCINTVS